MKKKLPDGWTLTTFGDVAEYINGRGFSKSEWEDEGRPIIRIQNLTGTGDTVNRYSGEVDEKHIIRDGELLISWSATIDAHIYHGEEAALNQHIFKVNTKESINKKFLYYLTKSHVDELKKKTQGTGMKHITKGKFEESEIPLPPLHEQERIVAKIEELFSKLESGVSELEVAEKRLGTYRQALLHKATTGELTAAWRENAPESTSTLDAIEGLREQLIDEKGTAKLKDPDRAEEQDDLPSGWESATVEQISYSTRYGTSEKCDYDFDGVPVLRIPNIQNSSINLDDLKFARSDADLSNIDPLESGDFLMVRTNGSSDLIGRAAVVRDEFDEPMYFASYLIRFRITPVDPLPRWVNFVWNSWPIREKILEVSATSAGQYNLSQSKVLQFKLPLPPLEEQEQILERVGRKMSVIDQLEQDLDAELRRSKRLRLSILKQAFDGNLVPQDPAEEPLTLNCGNTNLEPGKQATLSEVASDVE